MTGRWLGVWVLVGLSAGCKARDFTIKAGCPDDKTTCCFGMDCCPRGAGLRAVDPDKHQLTCRSVEPFTDDCFVDHGTQRAGMHACPDGTYVRGIEVNKNKLVCCFGRTRGFTAFANDEVVQDHFTRVCKGPDEPMLVTGLHHGNHKLLCRTVVPPPQTNTPAVTLDQDPEASRSFCTASGCRPASDFPMWKQMVRNWLARVHNVPVDRTSYTAPPPYASVDCTSNANLQDRHCSKVQTTDDGVQRRLLRHKSPVDGRDLEAYLFLPPGWTERGRYPAVLVTHGHFYGRENAKEIYSELWDSPGHGAARYLAESGAIALAPDTRSFGYAAVPTDCPSTDEQQTSDNDDCHLEYSQNHHPRVAQEYLRDNLTNLTMLLSQPGVDSNRVFTVGLSLGGYQAMWLGAIDERVTGGTINGCLFANLACDNDIPSDSGGYCQHLPALSHTLDHASKDLLIEEADVAALIPRFYAMHGDQDTTQTKPCIDTGVKAARLLFADLHRKADFFPLAARGDFIEGMAHDYDNSTSYEFIFGRAPPERVDWGGGKFPDGSGSVHACAATEALLGVRGGRILCAPVAAQSNNACFIDDGRTQRAGMHACPPYSYLRGLNGNNNHFLCCPNPAIGAAERVEPLAGQSTAFLQGFPVCHRLNGRRQVLHGLHLSDGRLLCGDP